MADSVPSPGSIHSRSYGSPTQRRVKGLILSGGRGTRLRPLTHTAAKQLVPVANKPVLFYAIESLVAAAVTEIGIIVGDTAAEVEGAVGDGSAFGAAVTYIPQEGPLGLAHAVGIARTYLGDGPFVMFLGDNIIHEPLAPLLADFVAGDAAAGVLLAPVANPSAMGVAEVNDGVIVSIVEKPEKPVSDLAVVGVYLLTSAIFSAIDAITPSPRGELEMTDALQWLIEDGRKVVPVPLRGWWKDTGSAADMLEANRRVLDGLAPQDRKALGDGVSESGVVVIGKNCSIGTSVLRGPVIIGDNVTINDAEIGPHVAIHDGAVIQGTSVADTIILQNARITDVADPIVNSLIGRDCNVDGHALRSNGLSMVIGDHSSVQVPA